MKRLAFLFVVLAGCMPGRDKADSTAQLTTDTVKPLTAADSAALASVDTSAKTSAMPTKTQTKTSTKSTATKTIGRDSVIRYDMGAKNRQLGKVYPTDSAKKPPRE